MKRLIIGLILLFGCLQVFAQTPDQDFNGKYYRFHGYTLSDSGNLFTPVDTTYHPFKPAIVYRAADSSFYKWNMKKWSKIYVLPGYILSSPITNGLSGIGISGGGFYTTSTTEGVVNFPGTNGGGIAYQRNEDITSSNSIGSFKLWTSKGIDLDIYMQKVTDTNTFSPWLKMFNSGNLSTDTTMGGTTPSDSVAVSQRAINKFFKGKIVGEAIDSTTLSPIKGDTNIIVSGDGKVIGDTVFIKLKDGIIPLDTANMQDTTISGGGGTTYQADETTVHLSGTTFSAKNTVAQWNANKLQGISISSTAPTTNQVLHYNGSTWIPFTLPSYLTSESDPTVNSYTKTLTSASVLLTQLKTVDGTSSGLDADMLDGQNGNFYLDDQIVSLTPGTGISISGTYPNFIISDASANIQVITSDYTLTSTDHILLVDVTAGDITITIPNGLPSGTSFKIRNIEDSGATNNVIIQSSGVEKINDLSTTSVSLPVGQFTTLIYYSGRATWYQF